MWYACAECVKETSHVDQALMCYLLKFLSRLASKQSLVRYTYLPLSIDPRVSLGWEAFATSGEQYWNQNIQRRTRNVSLGQCCLSHKRRKGLKGKGMGERRKGTPAIKLTALLNYVITWKSKKGTQSNAHKVSPMLKSAPSLWLLLVLTADVIASPPDSRARVHSLH